MTNKEISLKKQDEIAQSLINQKIESLESKQILASQLNSQIGNKEQTKYAEKEHDINLGKQLTGFQFECYPRKAEMIRQGYENTTYIKDQMNESQRRRRDQRNEEMKAPERLWTYEKLNEKKTEEKVERFNTKLENTKVFSDHYNKAMEFKTKQAADQRELDHQVERGIANIAQRNAYDRMVIDHNQKHEYGGSMRDQLSNNEVKRSDTIKEDKKAPPVIEDLRQESRDSQAFHLSKKPIITKFA